MNTDWGVYGEVLAICNSHKDDLNDLIWQYQYFLHERFFEQLDTSFEVKSLTIQDSGDPSVGMPATSYELSGGFSFEDTAELQNFKDDLVSLLESYGFIQGRAMVLTDSEFLAMDSEDDREPDYDPEELYYIQNADGDIRDGGE